MSSIFEEEKPDFVCLNLLLGVFFHSISLGLARLRRETHLLVNKNQKAIEKSCLNGKSTKLSICPSRELVLRDSILSE